MSDPSKPVIIPMLYIRHEEGVAALEFYKKAFGATVYRQFDNDDGTVHIAELEIAGTMFRFHEDKPGAGQLSPHTNGGTTINIGLRVADPDAVFSQAIAAGAKEVSSMQNFFYGYRSGDVLDPFGHLWSIEKAI
jgi:PhnB protein